MKFIFRYKTNFKELKQEQNQIKTDTNVRKKRRGRVKY